MAMERGEGGMRGWRIQVGRAEEKGEGGRREREREGGRERERGWEGGREREREILNLTVWVVYLELATVDLNFRKNCLYCDMT